MEQSTEPELFAGEREQWAKLKADVGAYVDARVQAQVQATVQRQVASRFMEIGRKELEGTGAMPAQQNNHPRHESVVDKPLYTQREMEMMQSKMRRELPESISSQVPDHQQVSREYQRSSDDDMWERLRLRNQWVPPSPPFNRWLHLGHSHRLGSGHSYGA